MLRTKCAACGTKLDSQDTTSCVRYLYESSDAWPGCARCQTRYCSAECRRAHWRDGHGQVCEEIARCGGPEQHYADRNYVKAAARAVKLCATDTAGQTCYICLGDTGEGLVRMCACRGTSGIAHLSCLERQVQVAVQGALHNEEVDLMAMLKRWWQCRLCEQEFYGAVACALGWACWKTYLVRPETDYLREFAMQILADLLAKGSDVKTRLSILTIILRRRHEIGDQKSVIISVRSQIADCLEKLERYDEAHDVRRANYEASADMAEMVALHYATDLGASLVQQERMQPGAAEALEFTRDVVDRARRLWGDDHGNTHKALQIYAMALYFDTKCSPEGLAEAETIISDMARAWRRKLGPSNPGTQCMEACQKVLRSKIAFNGVLDELLAAREED